MVVYYEFYVCQFNVVCWDLLLLKCCCGIGEVQYDLGVCCRDIVEIDFFDCKVGNVFVDKFFLIFCVGYCDFLFVMQQMCCVVSVDDGWKFQFVVDDGCV